MCSYTGRFPCGYCGEEDSVEVTPNIRERLDVVDLVRLRIQALGNLAYFDETLESYLHEK